MKGSDVPTLCVAVSLRARGGGDSLRPKCWRIAWKCCVSNARVLSLCSDEWLGLGCLLPQPCIARGQDSSEHLCYLPDHTPVMTKIQKRGPRAVKSFFPKRRDGVWTVFTGDDQKPTLRMVVRIYIGVDTCAPIGVTSARILQLHSSPLVVVRRAPKHSR